MGERAKGLSSVKTFRKIKRIATGPKGGGSPELELFALKKKLGLLSKEKEIWAKRKQQTEDEIKAVEDRIAQIEGTEEKVRHRRANTRSPVEDGKRSSMRVMKIDY